MTTALEDKRTEAGSPAPEEHSPPQSPRFRRHLLVVLAALALAGVVGLAWLLSTRAVGAVGVEGDQAQLQRDREAVMAQTEQFLLRMGTYGPDLLEGNAMPEYRERVKEVITSKFAVSFDQEAATAEQLVAQARISREAEVFATGVSAIDADSATALVAGAFTDSYPTGQSSGQTSDQSSDQQSPEPAPFRIEVSLVKVDGTWLVDNFTTVTGEDR
jgi:Mce-associated membrane protein